MKLCEEVQFQTQNEMQGCQYLATETAQTIQKRFCSQK